MPTYLFKWLPFALLTLVSIGVSVSSAAALDADKRQCIFRDVVAFGASVTQATPYYIPGSNLLVDGIEIYGKFFGQSPLVAGFQSPLRERGFRSFGQSPIYYLSKSVQTPSFQPQLHYIGSSFTSKWTDLGSSQAFSLALGYRRNLFDAASLVVGIDAFYWDAVHSNCELDSKSRANSAEAAIQTLIETSFTNGKILVLGNLPHENPANVRIDSTRTGVPYAWYPPNPDCVDRINATLSMFCKIEKSCYLIDLKSFGDDLNCGMKYKMLNGRTYGLYELRPDGVHMSDKGAEAVGELINQALQNHPPNCTPKN